MPNEADHYLINSKGNQNMSDYTDDTEIHILCEPSFSRHNSAS